MRRFRRRTTTRRARARDRRETRTVVTDGRTGGARIRFARENLDASSRAAATIEFYDFSFVIRASRANLASGARRADGGEVD